MAVTAAAVKVFLAAVSIVKTQRSVLAVEPCWVVRSKWVDKSGVGGLYNVGTVVLLQGISLVGFGTVGGCRPGVAEVLVLVSWAVVFVVAGILVVL